MRDAGLCTIYKLKNVAEAGGMPHEMLTEGVRAYYYDLTVGVTRHYAALSANQRIDRLIRAYRTTLDDDHEYCILEDGRQYRITLTQRDGDDVKLTLERLEDYYDVDDAGQS